MEDKELIEELYERIFQLEEEKEMLEKRKDNAIEYMKNYIEVEEYNEPVKCKFKEVMKILKGEQKWI